MWTRSRTEAVICCSILVSLGLCITVTGAAAQGGGTTPPPNTNGTNGTVNNRAAMQDILDRSDMLTGGSSAIAPTPQVRIEFLHELSRAIIQDIIARQHDPNVSLPQDELKKSEALLRAIDKWITSYPPVGTVLQIRIQNAFSNILSAQNSPAVGISSRDFVSVFANQQAKAQIAILERIPNIIDTFLHEAYPQLPKDGRPLEQRKSELLEVTAVGSSFDIGTEVIAGKGGTEVLTPAILSDAIHGVDLGIQPIAGAVAGIGAGAQFNLSPTRQAVARSHRRLQTANNLLHSVALQLMPLEQASDTERERQEQLRFDLVDDLQIQNTEGERFLEDLRRAILGPNVSAGLGYQYLNGIGSQEAAGFSASKIVSACHSRPFGILFLLSAYGVQESPNRGTDIGAPRIGATIAYDNELPHFEWVADPNNKSRIIPRLKVWTLQCGVEYNVKNQVDGTDSLGFFIRYRELKHHLEGFVLGDVGLHGSGYAGTGLRYSFGL